MREKLAKAGSHIAKRYNWENVAKQQIKAIKKLLEKAVSRIEIKVNGK